MTNKNSKFYAYWSIIRQLKKSRFILQQGVMGWGTTMFMFMVIFEIAFTKTGIISLDKILFKAAYCIIGGFVYGYWVWSISEKKYYALQLNSELPDILKIDGK